MGKMKERFIEEMNKQQDITLDEMYEMYKEAISHKTSIFDDQFDEIPFTVDFSKVEGIGETSNESHSTIMLSGNLVVIKTPFKTTKQLWNVAK